MCCIKKEKLQTRINKNWLNSSMQYGIQIKLSTTLTLLSALSKVERNWNHFSPLTPQGKKGIFSHSVCYPSWFSHIVHTHFLITGAHIYFIQNLWFIQSIEQRCRGTHQTEWLLPDASQGHRPNQNAFFKNSSVRKNGRNKQRSRENWACRLSRLLLS